MVRGAFQGAVRRWLDLERGVFDADVEVFGDAGLEVSQFLGDVALCEAGFVDDDMGGEDG